MFQIVALCGGAVMIAILQKLQRNDEVFMLSPARADVSSGSACRTEGCTVGSVLGLGALFGLMLSPCSRLPLVSAFVVVGVPLLTFLVAAPSRLGVFGELRLFGRDLQATVLAGLCLLTGRQKDARAVTASHQHTVEAAYSRLGATLEADPLRLHHARRLGLFGAVLAVIGGVGLPFIAGDTYTFGSFPEAPFVFLSDVLVIGLTARIVTERIAVRLFEASVALTGGPAWVARLRTVPLAAMLGGALGAVGALVVLTAAACASGLQSAVVFDADIARAGIWFLRQTAPLALPMGIGIGAVLGVGMGLAQRR